MEADASARVSVTTIAERLKEIAAAETKAGRKLQLTDAAALLIARKAEGGLRDAVSALDQVVSSGRTKVDDAAVTEVLGLVSRETFFDLAEPVFGRDPAKAFAQLHRAYDAGFDPKDAERLFEPFERGGGKGVAHGSGLGLFISRQLARRMHGELTAKSAGPGQGSVFVLELPLARGVAHA